MTSLRTSITGTRFKGPAAIKTVARLAPGDDVKLHRELGNAYDENAVRCDAYDPAAGMWRPVGYVPRKANPPVARALDRGRSVGCMVVEPAEAGWTPPKIFREPTIQIEWDD